MEAYNAEAAANQLRELGYKAFAVEGKPRPDGGKVFRVVVWFSPTEYSRASHRELLYWWHRCQPVPVEDFEPHLEEDLRVEVFLGPEDAAAQYASFSPYVDEQRCLEMLDLYEIPHEMAVPEAPSPG